MNKFSYDERKSETQRISYEYLNKFSNYNNLKRKHDISDAMVQFLYYLELIMKMII